MKLIIFDLDGTIIDSLSDLRVALNMALSDFNKNLVSEKEVRSFIGDGAKMLVKRALKRDKNYDDKEVEEKLKSFKKYYKQNVCKNTKLYSGVKKTLNKLPQKKAIVTNKPIEFVEEILETLEIKHFFDIWLGGDSLKEKKPSPKPLIYVCNKLDVLPNEAIMVGDSNNDILAAKRAGIKSIYVTYGYGKYEEEPDYIIDSFHKLLEFDSFFKST